MNSIHVDLRLSGVVLTMLCACTVAVKPCAAVTILDNLSPCHYNASIGMALDGSNPYDGNFLFPHANSSQGDPNLFDTTEPDLADASEVLGEWLTTPEALNGNWQYMSSAPMTWTVNTETAIVYRIDAGDTGLTQVVAHITVDNGVFLWLNGEFRFGTVQPGHPTQNPEYNVGLGDLSPGFHYLQVLREDHGGDTAFDISILAEPATLPECSDGIDNDGDGNVDYPSDLECSGPMDGSEDWTLVIIDDGSYGYFNESIGEVLDRTNPHQGTFLFPGPDSSDGDPALYGAIEPELSSAAGILGDWLGDATPANGYWEGPRAIPSTWAVNSETAIIYEFWVPQSGLERVIVSIDVDNGVYLWLDGQFRFGAMRSGPITGTVEYRIELGSLEPGHHRIQLLREDHGTQTGFSILVEGESSLPYSSSPGHNPDYLTSNLRASPNPFNPATEIHFECRTESVVELSVFDLAGRKIATLIDRERLGRGPRSVRWDGRDHDGGDLPAGVYVCRLVTDGLVESRRIVLIK